MSIYETDVEWRYPVISLSQVGNELDSCKQPSDDKIKWCSNRAPTGHLVKNTGNMGIFLSRMWEVYGIFQQKYGRNMGKIRVHQTKANIEDKSESKFMHLNITMF